MAGLAAGIGQALTAFAGQGVQSEQAERERRRQEDIQNTQLTRETEQYNRQKAQQNAEDQAALTEANQVLDDSDPTQSLSQIGQPATPSQPLTQFPAGAPVRTPALQGVANVSLGGPSTPVPSAQPAATPAPDPELQGLQKQYETIKSQLQSGIKAIEAKTTNPKERDQQVVALWRSIKNTQLHKDYEEGITSYANEKKAAAVAGAASKLVNAVTSGNKEAIESMFGPGARVGVNSHGLQGVQLPDGTFVGHNTVLSNAMLKARMITPKEFSTMAIEDSKEDAQLVKDADDNAEKLKARSMPSVSVHVGGGGEGGNKTLQMADDVQKSAVAEAKANGTTDPKELAKIGLRARNQYLNVPVAKVEATKDRNASLERFANDKNTYKELSDSIKRSENQNKATVVKKFADYLDDPDQGQEKARAYRLGLTGDNANAVDSFIKDQTPKTAKKLPNVASDADYQKLKKGDKYIGPDGKTYTKGQ